jgi:RNA-splicing ligase RtcB
MSRSEAKQSLILSDFKKSMEGIYTSSVNKGTLDEAPAAYKPMREIIKHIGDTADILKEIKPIYNFKAAE